MNLKTSNMAAGEIYISEESELNSRNECESVFKKDIVLTRILKSVEPGVSGNDYEEVQPEIIINIGHDQDNLPLKNNDDIANANTINPSSTSGGGAPIPPPDDNNNKSKLNEPNQNPTNNSNNPDESNGNNNDSNGAKRPRSSRVDNELRNRQPRHNIDQLRLAPVEGPFLCCDDIGFGLQVISMLDVMVASICSMVLSVKYLLNQKIHGGDECLRNGMICASVLVLIPLLLYIAGRIRSICLCIVYLLLSWSVTLAGVVLLFTMNCASTGYEKEVAMTIIAGIELGVIFKIYETNVIWHFLKQLFRSRRRRRLRLLSRQSADARQLSTANNATAFSLSLPHQLQEV